MDARRLSLAFIGLSCLGVLATSADAQTICKYLDSDGNMVYASQPLPPGAGLRLLSCDNLDEPDATGQQPPPARTEWSLIGENDTSVVLIRDDSIRTDGKNRVKAWIMYNFKTPQKQQYYPYAMYKSVLEFVRFDCGSRTLSTVQSVKYDHDYGNGEVVDSVIFKKPEIEEVVPDSSGAVMLATACKRRPR